MAAGDPEDTIAIALDALESRMRRQSDQRIKVALQMQLLRLAGFSKAEVMGRLNLSAVEYAVVWRKLREATEPGADEPD